MRKLRYPNHITWLAVYLLLLTACDSSPSAPGLQAGDTRLNATATRRPRATATDRPARPACNDAAQISLDHVGQQLCVTGKVASAYNTSEASYVELGACSAAPAPRPACTRLTPKTTGSA